jgi:hypothetical protein
MKEVVIIGIPGKPGFPIILRTGELRVNSETKFLKDGQFFKL